MIKVKITFKYNKKDELYYTIQFHLMRNISYIFTKEFHNKTVNNIIKKYIVDNNIYPQYSLYSRLKLFKYDKEYKDVIDNLVISEISVRFD